MRRREWRARENTGEKFKPHSTDKMTMTADSMAASKPHTRGEGRSEPKTAGSSTARFPDTGNWRGGSAPRAAKSLTTRWRTTAKKLERRLEALRIATAQAREIVEVSGDDDRVMDDALTRLVQQELFQILVKLKEEKPKSKELDLPTLARSVAQVGRISLAQQRRADELEAKVKEKVAAAEQKVLAAARGADDGAHAPAEGGLSPEAEERIRKALLEITQ
jgi:Bacteriophage Mu, Gp27